MRQKYSGSRDRIVLEYTFDQWQHDINLLKVRWYSRGFNAYFMYDILLGKQKRFSVAPGIGVGTSSIFTNSALHKDTTGTWLLPRTDSYKKNKIGLTYLDIPLEWRYRSKPNHRNNSFKIAIGVKAGLLVDGKTKVKQKNTDGDMKVYKEKRYEDFNRFRYGVTLRVGYGPFSIIGFYSLSKVFEKGKGNDITPYSIGIALNGL